MSNSSVKFHINIVQVVGGVNIRNGRQGIKRRFEDRDAADEDGALYQEVALDSRYRLEREKQGLADMQVAQHRASGDKGPVMAENEVEATVEAIIDCEGASSMIHMDLGTRRKTSDRTTSLACWYNSPRGAFLRVAIDAAQNNNVDTMGAFPVTPTATNTDTTGAEKSLTGGESTGTTMFSRDSRDRSTPLEGPRKRKIPYRTCQERDVSVAPHAQQHPPHHPITSLPTPPPSAGSSRASLRRSYGAVRITKPLPKKKRDSRVKSVTFPEQGDVPISPPSSNNMAHRKSTGYLDFRDSTREKTPAPQPFAEQRWGLRNTSGYYDVSDNEEKDEEEDDQERTPGPSTRSKRRGMTSPAVEMVLPSRRRRVSTGTTRAAQY